MLCIQSEKIKPRSILYIIIMRRVGMIFHQKNEKKNRDHRPRGIENSIVLQKRIIVMYVRMTSG